MDVFDLADGTQVSLMDILEDENMTKAFHYFLSRQWMAEPLEMWQCLQSIEKEREEREKEEVFLKMCEMFVREGCKNPINISFDTKEWILVQAQKIVEKREEKKKEKKKKEEEEGGGRFNIPLDGVRGEVWNLMATTCLHPFILSESFEDFRSGKIDSTSLAYSREKLENFFGMKIMGSIHRVELLTSYDNANQYFSVLKWRNISIDNLWS